MVRLEVLEQKTFVQSVHFLFRYPSLQVRVPRGVLGEKAADNQFAQQLGDAVAEAHAAALAHAKPSMAVFVAEANARGVEVVEHDHAVKSGDRSGHAEGNTVTGITYRMRDETTPKRRMRRRKASAPSSEFTHDALCAEFEPQPVPVAPGPAPQHAASAQYTSPSGVKA
ncbi:hypothetical protein [Actinomyces minihominis]|uniref:hypothetical protein n=1 Tax=Actinomyces minihominis TaxID=2002838 RepID=UPI001F5C6558|nr:hypothetical protein [Actinomyces minihominis]